MTALVLLALLAGPAEKAPIPVAVAVDRGEFETKATEDLDKLAKKFRERLSNGKVKQARLAEPAAATLVVRFLSKEWQPTGNSTTTANPTALGGGLKTTADTAFGVYGVLVVGDFAEPFNLRLSSQQLFNKDNTLSGMVDKHVEDFIKRNYPKLAALKR